MQFNAVHCSPEMDQCRPTQANALGHSRRTGPSYSALLGPALDCRRAQWSAVDWIELHCPVQSTAVQSAVQMQAIAAQLGPISAHAVQRTGAHWTRLLWTALHCCAIHWTSLDCTGLQSSAICMRTTSSAVQNAVQMQSNAMQMQCNAVEHTPAHWTALLYTALHYPALH